MLEYFPWATDTFCCLLRKNYLDLETCRKSQKNSETQTANGKESPTNGLETETQFPLNWNN